MDFAGRYIQHILGFIGIDDVTFVDASGQMIKGDAAVDGARAQIAALSEQAVEKAA